ncbi:MAG TPA: S-layer protein [Planctomycetaceae bacterium]|nr:S-layer protein [Planctomycetaceae bacterium]
MKSCVPIILILIGSLFTNQSSICAQSVILPAEVVISDPSATQQLLLQNSKGEEVGSQITEGVEWKSSDVSIAKISSDGEVTPVANGKVTISAVHQNVTSEATVTVQNVEQKNPPSFRHDILPVLSKAGCNSGACHGALAGKGGFRLSLRAYDPPTDFFNIVKQDQGRRVEFADPGRSLILAKPSGGMPHKGGIRFETDSEEYQILAHWISSGAPGPTPEDLEVQALTVLPGRSLHQVEEQQKLVVQATFSNGNNRDVTSRVIWSSTNEAVCSVDEQGNVTINGPGEGAIVAWYSSLVAIARITVPFPEVSDPLADQENVDQRKPRNVLDELIDKQLVRLNLPASAGCTDQTFVRRAYVDTIGRLPTVEETQEFLTNNAPEKRDLLIETLLTSEDFVDFWTYQWSDVMMINGTLLRPQAVKTYYEWLHSHVEKNTPWNEVVQEVVTATGSSVENGATNFYALHQSPEDMTENVSQAFLGLSIGCAKCHNHPLEKWTNDQYYGMANLFARVKAKGWGGESRNGDGIRTLYVTEFGDLVQPRTGKPQPPTPLDAVSLEMDDPSDRRIELAEWLTAPENPYFARSITNRIWARYFGVGLVEMVDDMRATNPASNEELLQAAADYLVEQKFDLKSLMRMILQSNAYQRSSEPLPGNRDEQRFYSRYYPRRMMAEVLHDAIVQVTGVPTKFDFIGFPGADRQKTDFYPEGTRAVELFDSAVENYFLSTFGRNPRNIVCECERSAEPSTVQVLHLSNGETINKKLKDDKGRVAEVLRLRSLGMSDSTLVDELYLSSLGRYPTAHERDEITSMLPEADSPEERDVVEDIFWAILSTREFLFNH